MAVEKQRKHCFFSKQNLAAKQLLKLNFNSAFFKTRPIHVISKFGLIALNNNYNNIVPANR